LNYKNRNKYIPMTREMQENNSREFDSVPTAVDWVRSQLGEAGIYGGDITLNCEVTEEVKSELRKIFHSKPRCAKCIVTNVEGNPNMAHIEIIRDEDKV